MKVIEVKFAIVILTTGSNLRVLLLHMQWKKWKVILYKISLFISALTYFSFGVYCFYVNYSFTFNILKAFDKLVKYFVILVVFTAFLPKWKINKNNEQF